MELTKYAKMYLDRRLTKSFAEAPDLYQTFIKTFGTHFFQNAFFGGMLKLDIETERSYFEKSTIFQIGLQAEGTFGQAVKLKGGIGVGNTNVDFRFKAASQETMRFEDETEKGKGKEPVSSTKKNTRSLISYL